MSSEDRKVLYTFDGFVLDTEDRVLMSGGASVPLTAKAFDTLVVLVENSGRLVEKDTLLSRVWADTFVEESTLAQNISTLRKAFVGHSAEVQFIETIPRHGYRFTVPVQRITESGDEYVIETRTRTRVVAEQTEITNPETKRIWGFITTRREFLALVLGAMALISAAGLFAYSKIAALSAPFSNPVVTNLISFGEIKSAVLSPDGQFIAVVDATDGMESIRVKQTSGTREVVVVPAAPADIIGLAYSPDGARLYYSAYVGSDPNAPDLKIGKLFSVLALGGPISEVLSDIDSTPAISNDGKFVAFIRNVPVGQKTQLVSLPLSVPTDQQQEKIIAERSGTDRFTMTGPAWSPNGDKLSANVFSTRNPQRPVEIVIIDASTGGQTSLTSVSWLWAGQSVWTSDGTSVIFPAFNPGSPNITDEVWIANISRGETRRLASGVNGVFGVSLSSDSKKLIAVRTSRVSGLWVIPASGGTGSILNKNIGDNSLSSLGISWMPNGKVIYGSAINGQSDIFSANRNGTNVVQLTNDPAADLGPVVSPDGSQIAFLSNRSGYLSLWTIRDDGSQVRQLSTLVAQFSPTFSQDGKWIYFSAKDSPDSEIFVWRTPSEGGEPQKVTERPMLSGQVSRNGQMLFGFSPLSTWKGPGRAPIRPVVISIDGKTVIKEFPNLSIQPATEVAWTSDGKGFTYSVEDHSVSNIWRQDIDGGPPQQITSFDTDQIFRYAFSPDGSSIAIEKGLRKNDIVLITNN